MIPGSDRKQHGGASHPSVYKGAPGRKAAVNRVSFYPAIGDIGSKVCPTCGHNVPIRKDGNLAIHRLGPVNKSIRKYGWPCKGEDEGAK